MLPSEFVSDKDIPTKPHLSALVEMTESFYDVGIRGLDEGRFAWRVGAYLMGPLVFGSSQIIGSQQTLSRDRSKIARSHIDIIKVQLVLDGDDRRQFDGVEHMTRAGDMRVSDTTRREEVACDDVRTLNLIIPRHLLGASEREIDNLHGMLLRKGTVSHTLLSAHLQGLWAHASTIPAQDAGALAGATASQFAGLLLAPHSSRPRPDAAAQVALVRLHRFINANLARPDLNAALLCDHFALSRASLYRLFESMGGVANHIRNQRLKAVYHALTRPDQTSQTIGQIAFEAGFANLSGFTRAFQRRFGLNPGDLRERSQRPGGGFVGSGGSAPPHLTLPTGSATSIRPEPAPAQPEIN